MRRANYLFSILALALTCSVAQVSAAQSSSLTATITDTDSQTWNSGTWTATLINPTPQIPPSINGTPLTNAQQHLSGTMSSSGIITGTFSDNNFIVPAGTSWQFTICPNASATCSVGSSTVTGASPNLSTVLSSFTTAPRFPANSSAFGYRDGEVAPTPRPGGTYFNVVTPVWRQWNGSAWTSVGSGGGGTPGGSNQQVQFNNLGAFAGATGLLTNGTHSAMGAGAAVDSPDATYSDPSTILNVMETHTDADGWQGIVSQANWSPTSTVASQDGVEAVNGIVVVDLDGQATSDTTATAVFAAAVAKSNTTGMASLTASENFAENLGAASIAHLWGVQGFASNVGGGGVSVDQIGVLGTVRTSGGFVDQVIPLYSDLAVISGGTVSNYFGAFIAGPSISGGAVVTTATGLHIDAVTGATTNRQIYSAGTAPSVFLGPITAADFIGGGASNGGLELTYIGSAVAAPDADSVQFTVDGAVTTPYNIYLPLSAPTGTNRYMNCAADPCIWDAGAGGGSNTIIGTATFEADSGSITNQTISGVITSISRSSAGQYVVNISGVPTNYLVMCSATSPGVAYTLCNSGLTFPLSSSSFAMTVFNASGLASIDPKYIAIEVVGQ